MLLKNLPEKQIIVMDNAAIHKSQKTIDLIEQSGHIILFLPPYSPDLNPIEKTFGWIKRALSGAPTIKQHLHHQQNPPQQSLRPKVFAVLSLCQ